MSAARTERLLNLLTLLLNTRRPLSLRELRELPEFDAYVSADPKSGERAFERDKAALVELGVPLRWVSPEGEEDEDGAGGYLIDRERYYLPELALAPHELALLSIVATAGVHTPGFPYNKALVRALAKLGFDTEGEVRSPPMLMHAPLTQGDAKRVGDFLATLYDALAENSNVQLSYAGLSGSTTERVVSPYGVYYRFGVWYMVGFCHLRQAMRTFHLSRAKKLVVTGKPKAFEVPSDFELSRYVQLLPWEYDVEPEFTAEIHVSAKLLPARRELFGPRAEFLQKGDGGVVKLQVRNREALIAMLLPLGAAAEVVAPKDLRKTMAEIYQTLVKRYGGRV